jgi:hypothetical protein
MRVWKTTTTTTTTTTMMMMNSGVKHNRIDKPTKKSVEGNNINLTRNSEFLQWPGDPRKTALVCTCTAREERSLSSGIWCACQQKERSDTHKWRGRNYCVQNRIQKYLCRLQNTKKYNKNRREALECIFSVVTTCKWRESLQCEVMWQL